MLMVKELNTFYALGQFSKTASIVLIILTFIFVILSLIWNVLYYKLDNIAGYIDGVIPLALVALMTIQKWSKENNIGRHKYNYWNHKTKKSRNIYINRQS